MSNQENSKTNSLLALLAAKFQRDNMMNVGVTIFLVVAAIVSILAGIAVWSVVRDLSAVEGDIGAVCSHLYRLGWITMIACALISGLIAFLQRSHCSTMRLFITNLMLAWIVTSVGMLTQHAAFNVLQLSTFMGNVLWTILSFIAGYILAVIPAMLATGFVFIVYHMVDLILPK